MMGMMRNAMQALALAALTILPSACGGSEDFAVKLDKSPASVVGSITGLDFSEAAGAISGLSVITRRPSEFEVLYTIPVSEPGRDAGESTIRLTLEPVEDGKATVVRADLDIKPVRMLMGKPNMVLSERKVSAELNRILKNNLGMVPLRDLLAAVAIASDFRLQSRFNELSRNPEMFDAMFDEADAPPDHAEPDDRTAGDDSAPEPDFTESYDSQPDTPPDDTAAFEQ
ncbi:MAG: hypothetical protein M0R03_00715 [Novosphingobium sp.]|nr:hypothetical protein [Novosphingobium sp.]